MKKLALVLGGGATKGYAHIGVLKVLEREGIKPDLIVGTSMGAIIGGLYASGKDGDYLEQISKQLTKKKLMDFSLISTFFSTGIMSGKKLNKLLNKEIGNITHEELDIPFIAVATDILKGEQVVLNKGVVMNNILASSAIPGVFPVVYKNNQDLCDGGLLNNVPDDIAKKFAKDYVVLSIDVVADYQKQVENGKLKVLSLTVNAITLMQTKITKLTGNNSDLRINISQPDVSQMSFDKVSITKSIDYGEIAMKKNMPKLKKLLQD